MTEKTRPGLPGPMRFVGAYTALFAVVALLAFIVPLAQGKTLIWEGDGFLMLTKRLEKGSYSWPRTSEDVRAMTPEQFKWLMHGFSIDPPIQVVNPDHCA